MVRQVKKYASILVCMLVLITAFCGSVQAFTHTAYENGSLSTTYITYFKDILSGIDFNDNYVAFRSGNNSYSMIVGDLEYDNRVISSKGPVKEYCFYTNNGTYLTEYQYEVVELNEFSVITDNNIFYSDVGDFPQLIERGSKFEILNTILIIITLLCVVVGRIFRHR